MLKNTLRRIMAAALGSTLACSLPILPSASAAGPEPCIYVVDSGGRALNVDVFCAEQALKTGMHASISRDGQIASPDEPLVTGQTLTLSARNGDKASCRTIAVQGDVTGQGSAGVAQLTRIAGALTEKTTLSEAQLCAGDFNSSGSIDLTDLYQAAAQLHSLQTNDTREISGRVLPVYFRTPEEKLQVPAYFLNGRQEIPFVSMDTVESSIRALLEIVDASDLTRRDPEEGVVVLERSTGSRAVFDFSEGTIAFSSFNAFLLPPYAATILDPLNTSGRTGEEKTWYFRRPPGSFQRAGHPVVIDLAGSGIDMPRRGNTGYIPLQTFSDFFLVPFGFQAIYNGQMIGVIAEGDPGALSDLYYAAPPRPRSKALADFTYRELCLVLDNYYGLKPQHDITDFDSLFSQTGLKDALLSTDGAAADIALTELADGYLGDLHTSFLRPSSYTGKDTTISSPNLSASVRDYHAAYVRFQQARFAAYPHGVPGYEEIGNTAFVTIEGLSWHGYDYYDAPPESADAPDTIGLICYAHRQIMREDSPIDTVVLDLSACGGGLTDAAIYVLSWFTGAARLDMNDTMTGAQASTLYAADVNLDGRFTEEDTIVSKDRYCLISPLSFSCGNIIPAAL